MIKEVVVTNSTGEFVTMTLTRPDSSGFVITNIQGLGPGKSTINVRENSLANGSMFNSSKTPSRNIVFTLRFLPVPLIGQPVASIENARLKTYRYFPNESRIRIDVTTDAGTFYIYGYVESNEPTIFSNTEGAVISVLCPDPFFRDINGNIGGTIESIIDAFSFPFSNESLVTKTIVFGNRFFQSTLFTIPFPGTVNVGPTLTIYAVGGQVNNPRITFYNQYSPGDVDTLGFTFTVVTPWVTSTPYLLGDHVSKNDATWICIAAHTSGTWATDVATKWMVVTNVLTPLENGDHLTIVCEKGNRSVTRFLASDPTHPRDYIGALTYDSSWPFLHPGDNVYSYDADDGSKEFIRFEYEYTNLYSGV